MKKVFLKILQAKIHKKTPMPEGLLLIKLQGLRPVSSSKKRLWPGTGSFLRMLQNFYKQLFLQITSGCLLLGSEI